MKIYERDKSIYKVARKQHGRDGETTSIRKRHNLKHNKRGPKVKIGEVVVIKVEERNKAQWRVGITTDVSQGRNGKVATISKRAGKSYLERTIKHPYQLAGDNTDQNGGWYPTLGA